MLSLGFALCWPLTLYQQATAGADPRNAASDDINFFGEWNLLGRDGGVPGFIAFSSEIRNRYTRITPAQLGETVGSAFGTTVGFDSQNYALTQLYWKQGSVECRALPCWPHGPCVDLRPATAASLLQSNKS